MNHKLLLPLIACLAACSSSKEDAREAQRQAEEAAGAHVLSVARSTLSAGDYDVARDSIFSLRKHHPLALAARKQGILLLDSIELMAARDSLYDLEETEEVKGIGQSYDEEHERLDMKVRFFERKIQEDKKRK